MEVCYPVWILNKSMLEKELNQHALLYCTWIHRWNPPQAAILWKSTGLLLAAARCYVSLSALVHLKMNSFSHKLNSCDHKVSVEWINQIRFVRFIGNIPNTDLAHVQEVSLSSRQTWWLSGHIKSYHLISRGGKSTDYSSRRADILIKVLIQLLCSSKSNEVQALNCTQSIKVNSISLKDFALGHFCAKLTEPNIKIESAVFVQAVNASQR